MQQALSEKQLNSNTNRLKSLFGKHLVKDSKAIATPNIGKAHFWQRAVENIAKLWFKKLGFGKRSKEGLNNFVKGKANKQRHLFS